MPGGSKQPDEITTIARPWDEGTPYLTGGNTWYGTQSGGWPGSIGGYGTPGYGDNGGYGFSGIPGFGGYPWGFNGFGGMSPGASGGPIGIGPEAANLYRNAPSQVAPFDPLQQQAQQQTLDYAGSLGGPLDQWGQSMMSGLSGGMNPYLDQAIASATRPLREQLREDILPAIDRRATMGTNEGSSRTGIAEGLAAGRNQKAIGDITGDMSFDAWRQSKDQETRAWALMPQWLQSGLLPAQLTEGVGAARQGMDLAQRAEPWNRFGSYAPYGSFVGTAGQSNISPSYQQGGGWMGALGGAAGGAGLASLLGGGGTSFTGSVANGGTIMGTAAANPWMWPLIIGGGLLGAFS